MTYDKETSFLVDKSICEYVEQEEEKDKILSFEKEPVTANEYSAQRKVNLAQNYNSMASEYSYASLYGCTDRVGNRQV